MSVLGLFVFVLALLVAAIIYFGLRLKKDVERLHDACVTSPPLPAARTATTNERSAQDIAKDLIDRHVIEYHKGAGR